MADCQDFIACGRRSSDWGYMRDIQYENRAKAKAAPHTPCADARRAQALEYTGSSFRACSQLMREQSQTTKQQCHSRVPHLP